jgi:ribosomal protein S18 acetylase RimI-like enzyme
VIEVSREVPAEIVDVYREAFGASPYFEGEREVARFAEEALPGHARRDGFRCVVAREDGLVVGFAYGYTSAPGQWWHDWVRSLLDAAQVEVWMSDAFELVELAVRPAAQGRGHGARLHDAVLADRPHRTALLTTRDEDTPARRLYRRRGWVPLREGWRPSARQPPLVFMGLRLPLQPEIPPPSRPGSAAEGPAGHMRAVDSYSR